MPTILHIENQYKPKKQFYAMRILDYIFGRKNESSSKTQQPVIIPKPAREGPWMTLEAIVINPLGIHVRPSALITRKALNYPGDVLIQRLEPPPETHQLKLAANCKSVTDIVTREITPNSKVKLSIEICEAYTNHPKIHEASAFCKEMYALVTSTFDEAYKEPKKQ